MATLTERKPPAIGVTIGPFNATLLRLIDSKVELGKSWPHFSSASCPAIAASHSISTPVASMHLLAARVTSGPIPSPGIKVILCAIVLPANEHRRVTFYIFCNN